MKAFTVTTIIVLALTGNTFSQTVEAQAAAIHAKAVRPISFCVYIGCTDALMMMALSRKEKTLGQGQAVAVKNETPHASAAKTASSRVLSIGVEKGINIGATIHIP